MADTTDSNSVAERREGSNPSPRTCYCGAPYEDYMHDGWHKLHEWNKGVFADAEKKKDKEFEAVLKEHNRRNKSSMPTVPEREGSLWEQ